MTLFEEYRRRTWEPADISAHQTEHAESLRVPFITSSHPHWNYLIGIYVGGGGDTYLAEGVVPTDDEVTLIASSLQEYCESWYNPGFRHLMADFAPYDIDGGANGTYFRKRPDGGWTYRKRTWRGGYTWHALETAEPLTLLQVLDSAHYSARRWTTWKAAHPELFAGGGDAQ
ncbi:hypothetical protein CH274_15535 [Rhodococcus sp. 06-418-5]|uniref:hypothetical protein n=1 Tax=Rhodococcus sp. 06-418-5 TaxID=2022507 RepID=UPI000B9BDC05|nr:hypothetical protein [Rhodococcus sp. 06-418-5]OZC80581.1 hypothetical protein CH274_15535 [Rhodococcus sp. 06-418-5]